MAAPNTTTADLANLVTTAYDRKVNMALRSKAQFRSIVDTKPVQQTHPGDSIVFNLYSDLSPATTPLNEVTDPTGVTIGDTTPVTVTLNEYGNYTVVTKRLQEFALDSALDSNLANIVAQNELDSIDNLVERVMAGSTNVITEEAGTLVGPGGAGQNVNDITGSDTLKSKHIRYAVAKNRAGSVPAVRGDLFGAYIHPDVAHDLRAESGSLGWRVPHESGYGEAIWAAEVGTYEGVFFVENPRCGVATNTGTVDVYRTYIFGQQAVAEAVAEEFHVVLDGAITDPLNRKTAMGWYGIAGWSLYRPTCLTVVKTASSIA